MQLPLFTYCLQYNTIQYNTYVYTTSTVNGASLTYGLRVFLHFFLHFSVWVAHHLQSPLSISSMSSLPFRRVSHDGRPFESQWVEGLKREPVLCRHLSSVPSIALARYLVALGNAAGGTWRNPWCTNTVWHVPQTSWNLCDCRNWMVKHEIDCWLQMGLGGGVFRYSYHWTKALKRLPRRCHGISISWFAKHYLCTQQHKKGERCHLGLICNLHRFKFCDFCDVCWLILQYLWWHDPMHLCGKNTHTHSLLEPASNM